MTTWNELVGLSGYYISPVISTPETNYLIRISNFTYTEVSATPSLTAYTRYSENGTTWSDWTLQTNNDNFIGVDGKWITKLQYKIVFERENYDYNPQLTNVTITANNKYLHLLDGSNIVYTLHSIPSGFTNLYFCKLPSDFNGIIQSFDDGKFDIGYNGTKFWYRRESRIVAGLPRTLPTNIFKIGVQASRIIITTDSYTEILI
jgi:hypothetical protein